MNDEVVVKLAEFANNERFAWDSYRRFILMFTNIAKGHPRTEMDAMLDDLKAKNGYKLDTEVTVDQLKVLVGEYKAYYKKTFGEDFPTDPYEQLREAVSAVFLKIRMSNSKKRLPPFSAAGTTPVPTSIVK